MSATPRLARIGYRRLDEASHGSGLKAIIAALSSEIPRIIADLDPRRVVVGGASVRPAARRAPATLPYLGQTHDHIEIASVLSGRCLVQMNNRFFQVKQGDVCFFTPGLQHTDTFVKRDSAYSLLWFSLGRQMVGSHLTRYSRRTGFNVVFRVSYDTVMASPRLTKDILNAVSSAPVSDSSLVHLKVYLLELSSILLNRLIQEVSSPREDWRRRVIQDAARYLQGHYLENPSLAEISAHVRLSPNYLCSLFHKHTGRTIVAHMNALRMKKAEDLLLNSGLSMKEIAAQTGFRSAQYFSRTFHRMQGASPARFRQDHSRPRE